MSICLRTVVAAFGAFALFAASSAQAQHRLITQGNDKLAIVGRDGKLEWQMPWGGIHDVHVLPNGNIMVQHGASKVVEIDRQRREVVWTYDSATSNGNAGRPVEVHAFQPLADGRVMIAESGPARIIEIDRAGQLVHSFTLKVEHPHPHTDTRLARKLNNGHYLVCHEGDGAVREYDREGHVVWDLFGAAVRQDAQAGPRARSVRQQMLRRRAAAKRQYARSATGNGHGVLEVTPDRQIVWQLHQTDLPGIVLAWVTTLEVLPNGHYIIGNCHAGPGQPLLIELDPKTKQVAWTFDQYDRFGNSVSNSQILDAGEGVLR